MSGNGQETAAAGPSLDQVTQAQMMIDKMSPTTKAAIGVLVRGLLVSFAGAPAHVILNVACYEFGNLLGNALDGDIRTVADLRRGFVKAFEEGMRAAPMIKAVPAGPPQMRG